MALPFFLNRFEAGAKSPKPTKPAEVSAGPGDIPPKSKSSSWHNPVITFISEQWESATVARPAEKGF